MAERIQRALHHTHRPYNPVSERYVNGLRWIVFDCECGETLPERRA